MTLCPCLAGPGLSSAIAFFDRHRSSLVPVEDFYAALIVPAAHVLYQSGKLANKRTITLRAQRGLVDVGTLRTQGRHIQ